MVGCDPVKASRSCEIHITCYLVTFVVGSNGSLVIVTVSTIFC
jgi:hypothetical protein